MGNKETYLSIKVDYSKRKRDFLKEIVRAITSNDLY